MNPRYVLENITNLLDNIKEQLTDDVYLIQFPKQKYFYLLLSLDMSRSFLHLLDSVRIKCLGLFCC